MVQDEQTNEPNPDDLSVGTAPLTTRTSSAFTNPTTEPSPPCLLYVFPRDWRPATLTLAVTFQTQPYPATVWGFHAANFIEAVFAEKRYELQLTNGTATCTFISPRKDRVYGVWWD